MTLLPEERIVQSMTAPGADFAAVDTEISGVTYKVFEKAPPNMHAFFQVALAQHGDATMLVYGEDRYTLKECYARASNIGAILHSQYGLKKGDHVALAMRNYPEWIFAHMAVTSIGAVVVPLNSWWSSKELSWALEHCEARLLIADEPRLKALEEAQMAAPPRAISVRCDGFPMNAARLEDLVAQHPGGTMPIVDVAPDEPMSVLYTSGSTGFPKGVVTSHRATITCILNWCVLGLAGAVHEGKVPTPEDPQQGCLLPIPLFHVTGCNSLYLLSFLIGRKVVFMHKWDVHEALRLIEAEGVTQVNGVPTMSYELMNAYDPTKHNLEMLVEVVSGGAARPAHHVGLLKETFPNARITSGYGLTETCGLGAVNWGDHYLDRPASTGKPCIPMVDMEIRDDSGHALPTGKIGEVVMKSAANFTGYLKDEDATHRVMQNGWFQTGDLGFLDEGGFLHIVDRKKDIIIRGGENISCLEVENAIYRHEAVAEASVFGVVDERLGERVCAVIMTHPNQVLTFEVLSEFLGDKLAGFKRPDKIWFTSESLPRIASGKIDKRNIRETYSQRYQKEQDS